MLHRTLAAALMLAGLFPVSVLAQNQTPINAPSAQPSPPASTRGLPPPPQPAVLPPVPAVAAGYRASNVPVPSGELIGIAQSPFVDITLGNAIAMALSRNTDLAVAQANRRIAGFAIVAAQGAYDMRFVISPSFSYGVSAPQSTFQAGPNFGPIVQNASGLNVGLTGTTQNGQQYRVAAIASRIENNSTFNAFNPSFPAALAFNFTQPLVRRIAGDDTRRALQLARINAEGSSQQVLLGASNTVAAVSDAYWDLVAAWRNVAIQEEALRQAAAQQRSNERLVRQGVSAPVDIVQSNTQVNVFQDNVFSALQNVARLQNQLKTLVLDNPADPIWSANLVPSSPVRTLPPEPTLSVLVTQAIARRPELAQIRELRRSADVNLAYARELLRPQIDLQVGYTSNGFAGQPTDPSGNPFLAGQAQQIAIINALVANANRTLPPSLRIPFIVGGGNPPVPGYLQGGFEQSLRNLASNKFPNYTATLNVGLPLHNRTAKANYAIAQEQERSLEVQQAGVIARITAEARNALQAYRSARYRLIAAGAARNASERVLSSEQRRFRAGSSTTFLVLQRQVDLASNRGRELQAQTDLNKAVVELQRASGAILTDNGVDASRVGTGSSYK
ncbi:MAG: TolC family protein [Candidatus Eremiobacteraeota bacterium]|nr:TolC family protein [Candidatus Eremiobacteraeota bacterium]